MTVKGGTSQACAACKYQRRKCALDCPLAPYFPADDPKMFQNAHRLYGVCNIMKILKHLTNEQKDEAMKSIIYESNTRQKYPVLGCTHVIWELMHRIKLCENELHQVDSLLTIMRNKEHCQTGNVIDLPQQFASQFQISSGANHYGCQPYYPQPSMEEMYTNSNQFLISDNKGVGGVYGESSDVKPFWLQQQQQQQEVQNYYMNNMNSNNSLEMKPFMISQQSLPLQQEIEVSRDYDDMPFDTIADDQQSYIDSKDACESSAESTLKDTIQSMEETLSQNHKLKSAAACFSLTSVN